MVNVKITRQKERIVEAEIKGHAGYAKHGRDIVCSAISAITSTALLGLIAVSSQEVKYVRNDDEGYLHIFTPKAVSAEEEMRQNTVLDTMVLGLRDLESGYKAFINLKEEVI